jgi:hypothetical protein
MHFSQGKGGIANSYVAEENDNGEFMILVRGPSRVSAKKTLAEDLEIDRSSLFVHLAW